jgi:hypothetical protein
MKQLRSTVDKIFAENINGRLTEERNKRKGNMYCSAVALNIWLVI